MLVFLFDLIKLGEDSIGADGVIVRDLYYVLVLCYSWLTWMMEQHVTVRAVSEMKK